MNPLKIAMSALQILPLIVAAVRVVEKIATVGGQKGKAKQDLAVDLVTDLLPLVEAIVGKDLLHDARVEPAVRATIDAVVALQNAVDAVRGLPAIVRTAPSA